jgi:hypothetical protein
MHQFYEVTRYEFCFDMTCCDVTLYDIDDIMNRVILQYFPTRYQILA